MSRKIDRSRAGSNPLPSPAPHMKSHKLVYVSALLVCCSAVAQESKPDVGRSDPAQVAMADYYECTRRYAEKYSKSREPAQDIADAALSYCENPRERLRSMLIEKLSAGGRSAREQVNSLFPGIIEKARLLGIRVVVESRYEATLGAGGAASVAPVLPGASVQPVSPPVMSAPDPSFSLPLIEGTAQAFPLAPKGSGAQPASPDATGETPPLFVPLPAPPSKPRSSPAATPAEQL